MRMTVPFSDDVATRWPQGENEIATKLDECAGITVLDDWNKIIIPQRQRFSKDGRRHEAHQVCGVEYLELPDGGVAGVREVAAGAPVGGGGDGEGAQPRPVRGRLVDDVHAGHVANVVDVKRLLQAHDQNLKQHISSSEE